MENWFAPQFQKYSDAYDIALELLKAFYPAGEMAHGVCLYWSISFTLEMMSSV